MSRKKFSEIPFCTCKDCEVDRKENGLVWIVSIAVLFVLLWAIWR